MKRSEGLRVTPLVKRRAIMSMLALLVPALSFAGCSSSSGGASGDNRPVKRDADVSVRILGDYDTLNAVTSANYSGDQMGVFSYDTLLALDDDGKIVPYVASSWKETPDSVLLHIRNDVKCQDGTTITPTDVKRSIDYMGSESTGAFIASLILGTNGFKVTADDKAGTVLVKLGKPYEYLLRGMTQTIVICAAGLEDPKAMDTKTFGTGPYTLTDSARGNKYVFRRRDGYDWGPDGASTATPGVPKTVTVKVVNSETTAANLLIGGGLDISFVQGRDVKRLLTTPSLTHEEVDVPGGANGLVLNQAPGRPGTDPAVRRALALAVDAVSYNRADSFGNARTLSTIYDPAMVCYDEADGKANLPYDVAEAKRVLREAGWVPDAGGKVHKDGKSLVIDIVGLTTQNTGPAYIQTAFDAIGVTTKLQQLDPSAWTNVIFGNGNWDATVYVFAGGYGIPQFIAAQASGPAPPDGINIGSIKNAEYDRLVQEAWSATGPKTCPLWQQGERALMAAGDVKALNTLHFDAFGSHVRFGIVNGTAIDPLTIRATK